jgi:DNA-binding CsgD family transcriptional regulator
VEKPELMETLRDLLVLLLLKSGVSYESIADVTGLSAKTLRNRFPIGKIIRGEE